MPVLLISEEERIGTTIAGRYRLDRILGRGGMGVVYGGAHLLTKRPVAVKFVRLTHVAKHEESAHRLLREARVAASLAHPNVVEILDMGTAEDGAMYLVMELLTGVSYETVLRESGPLDFGRTFACLGPIVHAMAAAHERGITHRDLKPENIWLSVREGVISPKLLDFGVALDDESTTRLTAEGMLLGTPAFMAPEQLGNDAAPSASADVWAMGVILYSSLAGRLPFFGKTSRLLMAAIVHADPRPLAAGRDVPAEAAALVMSALAKNPDARPSMRELYDALVAIKKEHAPEPVDLAPLCVPASSAAFDTEHFERSAIPVSELRPHQNGRAGTTGLGTGGALLRRRLPIPWLVTGALLMLALVFALWVRDERARGAAPPAPEAPAARLDDRAGSPLVPSRSEIAPRPSASIVDDEIGAGPVAEPRPRASSPRTRKARPAPPSPRADPGESAGVAPDDPAVAGDAHQGGAPAPTAMSSLTAPAPSTERGPRMIREF